MYAKFYNIKINKNGFTTNLPKSIPLASITDYNPGGIEWHKL
jgi:hypothetical protein